jgi:4-amino-4-deoxy-L-arabinose transferase-like glycosyltransferase
VRFAIAASLPPLLLLSLAATARNIYLAPALPGFALLVAWWAREILPGADRWDVRALRATAVMMMVGAAAFAAALIFLGNDSSDSILGAMLSIAISLICLAVAFTMAVRAWRAAREQVVTAQWALLLAYCALLIGPASQIYRRVDAWQNLAQIARAVQRDSAARPLVLLAPDETTRAIIDMYARPVVDRIAGPWDAGGIDRVRMFAAASPESLFLLQLPSQAPLLRRARAAQTNPLAVWQAANLEVSGSYSLPNGRRYALLRVRR